MKKMADSIEEEIKFQEVEWTALRVGWILMGLFLLIGLLGLLGTGAFSHKIIQGNNMKIEYDRYLRYSVKTEVHVKLKDRLSDSTLSINSDYIRAMKIDKIIPEPSSMTLNGNKLAYKFASDNIEQISFFLEPIKIGSHNLEMETGEMKKTISQFIFF